jgi:hypothetical protein
LGSDLLLAVGSSASVYRPGIDFGRPIGSGIMPEPFLDVQKKFQNMKVGKDGL